MCIVKIIFLEKEIEKLKEENKILIQLSNRKTKTIIKLSKNICWSCINNLSKRK